MSEEYKERNEGYKGLASIFVKQGIDITEWVHEELDKERGGMSIMTPNVDGEIYLTWGDLYHVDLTFALSGTKFKETVFLGELELMLAKLEDMRRKTVANLRDMLKKSFSKLEEE